MIQDNMDLGHQSCEIFAANHLPFPDNSTQGHTRWKSLLLLVFFFAVPKRTFFIYFILANMYITEPSKRDKDRSSCILLYKIPAYNECVIFQYILLFFKDNENDVVGQTLQMY